MKLRIGVVGATGMVGEAFMHILSQHRTQIEELRPFASERSHGLKIALDGKDWLVQNLEAAGKQAFQGLDVVFFSSGDDISKDWAPVAVENGAVAIDNSAAFRMNDKISLIVPEVNGHLIPKPGKPELIANPNCSTIQLVVPLNALKKFGLKDVKVATYQAVSGAGKAGSEELLMQTSEQIKDQKIKTPAKTFTHPIAFNCIPQIGSFNDMGFCSEEWKIMQETKKILELPNLAISAFTVRVPVLNAHSEAVWVTLDQKISRNEFIAALEAQAGLVVHKEQHNSQFPTALTASGDEPVHIGRIHQDPNQPNTWLFWVVADNILKGAALNGLQIAERIFHS